MRIARALSVMMLQQCRDMLLKKQKHKAHLLSRIALTEMF